MRKSSCRHCERRRRFIFLDIILFFGRAFERFGPLAALLLALTSGVASAASTASTAGYMQLPLLPVFDMMGPQRAFPTPRRVLAMLRFAAPVYGLDVQQVTSVRPGPKEGSDKTGVAEYRYRYRGCAGSARVHVIGGKEIEGGWRLRDVAELQHVGEHCGK